MRTTNNVDNTGWATFATAFGLVTVSDLVWQIIVSLSTLILSITVAHFYRGWLNRNHPQQKRRTRKPKPSIAKPE